MEILIGAVIIVGLAAILWNHNKAKPLDVNKDGKVDVADAVAAVTVVAEETTKVAKKVATKAKAATTKKAAAKKPAPAKKTVAAKKPATTKKSVAAKKPKK